MIYQILRQYILIIITIIQRYNFKRTGTFELIILTFQLLSFLPTFVSQF